MELSKITCNQNQKRIHVIERAFSSYMLGQISCKQYNDCVDYLLSL